MKLEIKQVIEYFEREEIKAHLRIIYIEPTFTNIAVINLKEKNSLPYWLKYQDVYNDILSGLARFAETDNFLPPAFSAKQLNDNPILKEKRDSARKTIENLVKGENKVKILYKKERTDLIESAALLHKVSRQTIFKNLRLYWFAGMTFDALIPRYYKCGGVGKKRNYNKKPGQPGLVAKEYNTVTGVVMNDEWLEIIIRGGRLFYENLKRRTLREAYDLTLLRLCSKRDKATGKMILPDPNKGEVFSFRQFKYHYKKEIENNLGRIITKRHGQRSFNTNYAPRTGNLREGVFGPGSLYQVDATLVDTSLLGSVLVNKIIGRPTIYVILDVFSLYIVAVAVRLESENWLGYREALINIVEDKVDFCSEYGVEIKPEEWINASFADQFMGDRGSLESSIADNITNGIGSQLSVAGPNRPDWKAYVEQMFNLMNIFVFHGLPGAVPQAPERDEKDYRIESLFTLEDFMQTIIKMVIFFNNHYRIKNYKLDVDMISDNVEPYPCDLYVWGSQNRSVPTRRHSLDEIKIHLLPDEEGTVTEFGVRFRGLYFTSETSESEGWELKAKQLKNWKVIIAYHPRKVEPVYLRFADGRPLQPCYLKDFNSLFKNWDWSEVKEYLRLKNLQNQMATGKFRQSLSDLKNDITEITKRARKRKENNSLKSEKLSMSQQLSSIDDNKKQEIEYQNMMENNQIEEAQKGLDSNQSNQNKFEYIIPVLPVNLQELKERRLNDDENQNK